MTIITILLVLMAFMLLRIADIAAAIPLSDGSRQGRLMPHKFFSKGIKQVVDSPIPWISRSKWENP